MNCCFFIINYKFIYKKYKIVQNFNFKSVFPFLKTQTVFLQVKQNAFGPGLGQNKNECIPLCPVVFENSIFLSYFPFLQTDNSGDVSPNSPLLVSCVYRTS